MGIKEELEQIADAHDGILRPEDIVAFATNPETALHKRFTWDDTEAAKQWRLQEARQVLRVYVTVEETPNVQVRAYVSLYSDRRQPGGGYRRLADVMADEQMRRLLLRQAMKEAKTWREKFQTLEELGPVFTALDEIEADVIAETPLPEKVIAVMSA